MMRSTIVKLNEASDDLKVMIRYGKEQAARSDADKICRLGDVAIEKYSRLSRELDEFTAQYKSSFGM